MISANVKAQSLLVVAAGALLIGAVGCGGPSRYELLYRAELYKTRDLETQRRSQARAILDLNKEIEHLEGKLNIASEAMKTQDEQQREEEERRQALLDRLRKATEGTPAEVERRGDTYVVITRFSFEPGMASLDVKARSDLRKIGEALTGGFVGATFLVAGHADASKIVKSNYQSNWHLSGERARSVMEFLVDECNIPPERIAYGGYGEFRPVADNSTLEGREKNRRVEIIVNP